MAGKKEIVLNPVSKTPRFEPFGRPPTYDPKFCQLLADALYEGKTVIQFCRDNRIGKSSFYEWKEKFPEFKAAFKNNISHSGAHFVDLGEANLFNKDFNVALYKYLGAVKHGYSDKMETKTDVNHNIDIEIREGVSREVLDIQRIKNKYIREY